ncbi:MAG: sulfatase [Rikenellaceae bacterium]
MMIKAQHLIPIILPIASMKVAYGQTQPNIVWIVSEDNSKQYMDIFNPEHGVATPNLEAIAAKGVVFPNAFSNAPVSSAARSTLITGCYGPRLASHYHRYEAMTDVVDGLQTFPAYLKQAGYYTANNAKEDYNVNLTPDTWDESSKKGSWRNRKEGQPFFYVHNFEETHESRLLLSEDKLSAEVEGYDGAEVFLQPNYPDTKIFRDSYLLYCKKVQTMDNQVGELIAKLEEDNLLDDTIIFYYGDNGGILPASKGYLTEMGLNVPLIVYVPEKYQHLTHTEAGSQNDRFVSFVDFAPTVLSLAGIEVPKEMDGESIFEERREEEQPIFGYADRMGEKYDMVRSLRKGKYKYVRNYQPFNFDALTNGYRYKIVAYQEWRELYYNDELTPIQKQFFEPKGAEMLFDIEQDPYQTKNLAGDPQYHSTLKSLRAELIKWQKEINDLGFYPEFHLTEEAYPATAAYGVSHSRDIDRYIAISNLCLQKYDKGVERKLTTALNSNDPFDRYWALIACHSIGDQASKLFTIAKEIAACDSEPINRVRAAEFLSLDKDYNYQQVMIESLYATKRPLEAALILNSMAVLNQQKECVHFNVDNSRIDDDVLKHTFVATRLKELKLRK